MAGKLLRVAELAEFCGLSVSYLNTLRVTGGGPVFVKLGRAVFYDPADVSRWIEDRKQSSTSAHGVVA